MAEDTRNKMSSHDGPDDSDGTGSDCLDTEGNSSEDRFRAAPVLFYQSILFLGVTSRNLLSPILVRVENDLGMTHSAAGRLFLAASGGYCIALLISGSVSKLIGHRRLIILSTVGVGCGLAFIAMSSTAPILSAAMFLSGLAGGFYIPSGVASIYGFTPRRHWGKAIAVHEMGPNVGLFLVPFIAQIALATVGWRTLMLIMSAVAFGLSGVFAMFAPGGRFPGESASFRNVGELLRNMRFLVITVIFLLNAGIAMGTYAMLPTFLATERGIGLEKVNVLFGASRVSVIFISLIAGFMADRWNLKYILAAIIIVAGGSAVALGIGRGALLVAAMFCMPVASGAFFSVAYTVIAKVTPYRIRNVTVSLVVTAGYLFGGGIMPAIMGMLGDMGHFDYGFIGIGVLCLSSLVLIPALFNRPGTS